MEQSLLFTVLSLASFYGEHFPNVDWYPYWYLGNPYHYLIGPVVPVLLVIIGKVFPATSYHIYLFLILSSLFAAAGGVYLFVKEWGRRRFEAVVASVLMLFIPSNLWLLYTENGLKHVSFAFIPVLFFFYLRFLRTYKNVHALTILLLVTLILLTNAASILVVLVGFVAIFVAERKENKQLQKTTEMLIVKTVLLIVTAIALATVWYTPSFWWIVLANPSFGGVPLFRVVGNIFSSLLSVLPIILAVLVVKWRHYKLTSYALFCILFFSAFGVLTLFRFLADPDFVSDWLGFGLELQLAGAFILSVFASKFARKNDILKVGFVVALVFIVTLWGIVLKDIFSYTQSPYKTDISALVDSQKMENKRTFLSGSPVFWINNSSNVTQVRGGNDGTAIHPSWAHAAYQIREGEEKSLSDAWLKILGASYILIHTEKSKEPFHDFKHPEKFKDYELVASQDGNNLYHVDGVSKARVVYAVLLRNPAPTNGADTQALSKYILSFKRPTELQTISPTQLKVDVDLSKNEVVSLAMTHDSAWKLTTGKGRIVSDSIGNTVIIPDNLGNQQFVLKYQKSSLGFIFAFLISSICFVAFFAYHRITPHIKKHLPSMALGLRDENDEY